MKKWYRIALFNLFVLTILGLILRYKINFPLEFIEQKNLLHAHSHFAFNGWISFLLQVLIIDHFTKDYNRSKKFWDNFFIASTIINYGMIFAFAWQGYAGVSIALSTLALWLSYIFIYAVLKALPGADRQKVSVKFIIASLFFLALSSLGPYLLAIVIATKSTHQYFYHNALYFFLHFQYNGWFLFAILGFLLQKLEVQQSYSSKTANRFFMVLLITCIPAYLLTMLWHHVPYAVTVINVVTVLVQASSLYFLFCLLTGSYKSAFSPLPAVCRYLYSFAIAAFILKVLLQFFAAHPQLGQLAFAFRPIIIGYLHLVFLVFVSLYMLGLLAETNIISLHKPSAKTGLIIFSSGVIINELLLAVQGFASIFYWYLPAINILLFANTFTMVTGAFLIYRSTTVQTDYSTINIQSYATH